jgi:hypothetical protein
MKIEAIAALGAAALLVACAKNPESITPMTMPVNAYSGLTCEQLAAEHQSVDFHRELTRH